MYHEYPYTTYYNDVDQMCRCCSAANIHLDTHGDYLRLINDADGSVISSVKVTYSDTALEDIEGRPIKAYLIQASTNGANLVFTHGDGTLTTFEVPYAQTAAKDVQNKDILDYVYGLSISGDKVRITQGDATIYELTIPFATKAATDVNDKDLTTYAATLTVDGRDIVLSDSMNRELSRITVPYAVQAKEDVDGDDIKSTYGTQITTGTTTIKLIAKDSTVLSEVTVPYATIAVQDTDGNLFLRDYAEKIVIDTDGKKIGVEAHDGTRLATITVPFATLATDATNAVESVQVSGDQIIFTTYGGQTFSITAPYSVKAEKDDQGNTIKSTYFASVSNDTNAGTITFYDALGQVLATIQNGVITRAIYDDYNNPLAGYIKTLSATAGSDYLTATHGDGTVDSIKVDYSERAWKDTNGNVIKNSYVKRLAIAQDPDDNQWKLFAFNGDNPEALLYALVITAEQAYKDVNGKLLTSYVAEVSENNGTVTVKDGEGTTLDTFNVGNTITYTDDVASIYGKVNIGKLTVDGVDTIVNTPIIEELPLPRLYAQVVRSGSTFVWGSTLVQNLLDNSTYSLGQNETINIVFGAKDVGETIPTYHKLEFNGTSSYYVKRSAFVRNVSGSPVSYAVYPYLNRDVPSANFTWPTYQDQRYGTASMLLNINANDFTIVDCGVAYDYLDTNTPATVDNAGMWGWVTLRNNDSTAISINKSTYVTLQPYTYLQQKNSIKSWNAAIAPHSTMLV